MHLDKGYSLVNPGHDTNSGYAPTFEQLTQYQGRIHKAARWPDLLAKKDPDRPWIDSLPRLIFVSNMGDAFNRKSDFSFLRKEVIEPVASEPGRRHLWLWLTKRPELMAAFAEDQGGFPDNICAMTTLTGPDIESRKRLDDLRRVKASIRGLSLEPIWERIPPEQLNLDGIDWVIIGGESGSTVEDSRPFALEWAEELREHCQKNGVAFFLKQLGRRPTLGGQDLDLDHSHGGDWTEWPDAALRVREFPQAFYRYRADEPTVGGLRRVRKGGLIPSEANDFKRLHKIVSNFVRDMIVAADAFYEIRDRHLYRGQYSTFSAYCESVHEMSRQYANRLIKAGQIRAEMVPIVSKLGIPEPQNEAQLRELSRLKTPKERIEIYRKAVDQASSTNKKVTARLLATVIDARQNTESDGSTALLSRLSPRQRIEQALPLLDDIESRIRGGDDPIDLIAQLRKLLENSEQTRPIQRVDRNDGPKAWCMAHSTKWCAGGLALAGHIGIG